MAGTVSIQLFRKTTFEGQMVYITYISLYFFLYKYDKKTPGQRTFHLYYTKSY